MVLYDRRKLLRASGGSAKRIILAFKAHISTRLPKNRWDPLYDYYYKDFTGESFMLDPHSLINNSFRYTPGEVASYIGLASFRSYSYYRLTKDPSLDLFHCPSGEDKINSNQLLRIVDGRVHFYYEEDLKERNKIWH